MNASVDVPLTWVDVARRLAAASIDGPTPPSGIVRARVSWYGLTVETMEGCDASMVLDWLDKIFTNRIKREPMQIELDGPAKALDILIECETSKAGGRLSFGIVDGVVEYATTSVPQVSRPTAVVACMSVKGGTGRTMSAVAFAHRWAKFANAPVLLVDADIEAPGISYMFEGVAGPPKVSLEDAIVLAHSDDSVDAKSTIDFVAERLRDHMVSENVYVLPLRRSIDELASSAIRAEHLSTPEHPFALADMLSAIGQRLGCAGVVVDVRAGLVPIGVNLALDPNVSPIFTSTLSSQSLRATGVLTSFLAREVRRNGGTPRRPLLIINRVPGVFRQSGMDQRLVAPLVEEMVAALVDETEAGVGLSDSSAEIEPLVQVAIPELPDIQVMSGDWREYVNQLVTSGFETAAGPSFDRWISSELLGGALVELNVQPIEAISASVRQVKLRDYADKLIAAENIDSTVPRPLVTKSLASLARRFQSEVPIAISEGAKGTGKTMAARYFVSRGNWSAAVKDLVGVEGAIAAPVLPVTGSAQASAEVQREVDSARHAIAAQFGFGQASTFATTTSHLRESISKKLSEREWIDVWLDVIAWSAGYEAGNVGVGAAFISAIRAAGRNVVALMEGLEELYESVADPGVEAAMRAALVSLPQRLRSEIHRPLGVLVFARRDTVESAIKQNLDQFRREYASFALSWSEGDVLELAAWLGTQSEAVPDLWDDGFAAIPDDDKKKRLEALWGKKLGPEDEPGKRTREAYTATWIVAVLSDLRGRLVPRDLVRLLATAAASSASEDERRAFPSRLLVPRSIRNAVEPTSEKKVLETKEEIPELQPILSKFEMKPDEIAAPLTQESLDRLGLSGDDVRVLVKHGIVFGERAPYEVPELFRRGLGLKHVGARRSVVNLYLRARQRYAAL